MQKANLKTGDKKAMHGKIFRKANISYCLIRKHT